MLQIPSTICKNFHTEPFSKTSKLLPTMRSSARNLFSSYTLRLICSYQYEKQYYPGKLAFVKAKYYNYDIKKFQMTAYANNIFVPQTIQMDCRADIHHSSCSYHQEEIYTKVLSIQEVKQQCSPLLQV